jgi:hypothetical protein
VDSILEVKFQLAMHRFISMVLLFLLIFVFLHGKVLGQCPEHAVSVDIDLSGSVAREIRVFDSFNSDVNISGFEINIFNEKTGNYLIAESNNFPSIGIESTIEFSKAGSRIQLSNIPAGIDLSGCVVILIGNNCPVKKISITNR